MNHTEKMYLERYIAVDGVFIMCEEMKSIDWMTEHKMVAFLFFLFFRQNSWYIVDISMQTEKNAMKKIQNCGNEIEEIEKIYEYQKSNEMERRCNG